MRALILAAAFAIGAATASAQLKPYEDYEVDDAVWSVTTVKVDANMGDYYLEGLRDTWVASNEVAKELGHIEDYAIVVSELPASGDFNMMLMVKYASTADLEPSQEKYEAFMEAWGDENQDLVEEKVMDYPSMREITGEYMFRNLKMK